MNKKIRDGIGTVAFAFAALAFVAEVGRFQERRQWKHDKIRHKNLTKFEFVNN